MPRRTSCPTASAQACQNLLVRIPASSDAARNNARSSGLSPHGKRYEIKMNKTALMQYLNVFLANVNKLSVSALFHIQCSVTCGRGYQARFIKCAEKVCIVCVIFQCHNNSLHLNSL